MGIVIEENLSKRIKSLRFLLIVFVVFIVGFIGCGKGENEAMEIPIPAEIPIPVVSLDDLAIVPVSCLDQWWIDRHNEKRTNVIPNQKIIFIGDSITERWEGTEAWAELNQRYNSKITNLGFGGDQTQHVIWRLENGEFPVGINPEYVVLMIGLNNHGHKSESIAAGIGKIIEIINTNSPLAKIILLSILPIRDGVENEITVRNNTVNDIINKYDGYLNTQYLDISINYINSNGSLKEELFTNDRVHLAPTGYNVWKEKLIEIIN